MKLHLYPHGGCGNHGCEAIVRSTKKITGASMTLFSMRPEEDLKYITEPIVEIKNEKIKLTHTQWIYWKAFIKKYFFKDTNAFDKAVFSPVYRNIPDFFLSIGGDNYCYGAPEFIYLINKEIRKRKVKNILWGCSIEPESIKERMLEDLQEYTHIIARESITYQALKDKGIKQVSLYPDPAFQLDQIDEKLPNGFIEGNTVGINVSPMVIGLEKDNGITLENYTNLIQYLINHTDMSVALIPHVVWDHNDDRKPLTILYNRFKETGRVILIDDAPAEILKGYIARCRFLIAARTHASIAAYSTQVPTLVVGYSVKAQGIATDIFGTDENYVIPVQSLKQPEDLTDAFKWLMQHESDIRTLYNNKMPSYCEAALQMKTVLDNLL
ncbi:polysaccharide pyruvyl transferase family protein [uncultured Bacteroides sp.]|uniref:polysaccharide pyruvyl transferase family protein n=1 Tax=uncultured Bacteroides sp. TaxID=162156 RepID=UPI002603E984|nr:polysaccharide pyruvyl transferase family protein [uncultured Bacteroides sp.]